jgi:hypothetical protein
MSPSVGRSDGIIVPGSLEAIKQARCHEGGVAVLLEVERLERIDRERRAMPPLPASKRTRVYAEMIASFPSASTRRCSWSS